jgi:hypothetical protein
MEYERSFALCDVIMQATKRPFTQRIYYAFICDGFNTSICRLPQKQCCKQDVIVTCFVTTMGMKHQSLYVLFCKYIYLVAKTSIRCTCTIKYNLNIVVERPGQRSEVYVNPFSLNDACLRWDVIE